MNTCGSAILGVVDVLLAGTKVQMCVKLVILRHVCIMMVREAIDVSGLINMAFVLGFISV